MVKREWNKKNVSIYLDDEEIKELDTAAKKNNLSRNKFIIKVLQEWFNNDGV